MSLTPMMQQYLEIKESCKDCILFFRLGDFYEMFFEDAEIASKELELVLTGRDCGLDERAPMCGIPYHAANSYVGRLVNRGYKIAICEQMEDPALAKGIVKRDLIKIITPGTYTESDYLDESKNNYVMSIYIDKSTDIIGIATSDVSTGEFNVTNCSFNINPVLDEISKFSPKEILIQQDMDDKDVSVLKERFNCYFTILNSSYYDNSSVDKLKQQFKDFDISLYNDSALKASSALLLYIHETQRNDVGHINSFDYYSVGDFLSMDINTRRNLEITENIREKSKRGSLLWILDKTSTAMGGRTLRKWIEEPLVNKALIEDRLNAIEELIGNYTLHEDLKDSLKEIYDIERIVGKIASKNVNAKELVSLKLSLNKLPAIKNILSGLKSNLFLKMYNKLDTLEDVYNLLEKSIIENPPISVKEGNIIKDGYSAEVDELRNAKSHGKEWIASLENQEREFTGIKSLKVGYNKVFGYYIEITKSNLNSVPEGRYVRKQTLANAERYITPELKEMEDKILGAEEKLISLEYNFFTEVREKIELQLSRMKLCAKIISDIDCLSSLTTSALENNYCKPVIVEDDEIEIKDGRHPVVEKVISNANFVTNDTIINNEKEQMLLITGPNMAGKSTYMRQVALITLMAQIGSFVPASYAKISICDKIFTRIGASDDLSAGKSTFMVEMWEVSNILKNATRKSLILLDEVGRGTSTYDGLSIAWAVIEYICNNKDLKCKTLFATHYHELTQLENIVPGVKNYSVSVKEIGEEIIFLRKIISGGADQSYGIEVAKLAGLPDVVISRAKEILKDIELEKSEHLNINEIAVDKDANKKNKPKKEDKALKQIDFMDLEKSALIKEMANLNILDMNPMEGFNKLYELINKAKNIQ
ncbi:MAG: mismatch repair protein MutS [Clostridiaceae bacterium]|jgi:DNA mismatch repair protein MutS|nr:mismatch repair protein MutS [Clostridiaceae bacterium]